MGLLAAGEERKGLVGFPSFSLSTAFTFLN